jgi:hypothetical protein
LDFIASLRAEGDAGAALVVAVDRFVLFALAPPGEYVCAATAAAMQNETVPATRAGVESVWLDMITPRSSLAGSRCVQPRADTRAPA